MRAPSFPPDCSQLQIHPWYEPASDAGGHDPRSAYVERYWLGTLGPSVTWFLRHVADRFDDTPDGFRLDLAACARALGLGQFQGRGAALPRTVARCCQFDMARMIDRSTLAVRPRLPPLTLRQLAQLPDDLRQEHTSAYGRPPRPARPSTLEAQARRVALSMLELGDGPLGVERKLRRWRFPDQLAHEATRWALAQRARRRPTTDRTTARSA